MSSTGPAMPFALQRVLAARRRKQSRAVAIMVSLGVAFAVASSFLTVGAIVASTEDLSARVIAGDAKGLALAQAVARRASLPFTGMSALTLCISAAAISCVLAVGFIGRKRSLGILKVLGTTTKDLYRLFALETCVLGGLGIPVGLALGLVLTTTLLGNSAAIPECYGVSLAFGVAALALGVYLPLRLVRNGSCAQLLNNRPVYASSNSSCAKCGLCGGF